MTSPIEFDERFADWADGVLPAEEQAILERAIAADPQLRARWREYQRVVECLRAPADPSQAPDDLVESVMAATAPRPASLGWLKWGVLAAAAAVVVVVSSVEFRGPANVTDSARGRKSAQPSTEAGAADADDRRAGRAAETGNKRLAIVPAARDTGDDKSTGRADGSVRATGGLVATAERTKELLEQRQQLESAAVPNTPPASAGLELNYSFGDGDPVYLVTLPPRNAGAEKPAGSSETSPRSRLSKASTGLESRLRPEWLAPKLPGLRAQPVDREQLLLREPKAKTEAMTRASKDDLGRSNYGLQRGDRLYAISNVSVAQQSVYFAELKREAKRNGAQLQRLDSIAAVGPVPLVLGGTIYIVVRQR